MGEMSTSSFRRPHFPGSPRPPSSLHHPPTRVASNLFGLSYAPPISLFLKPLPLSLPPSLPLSLWLELEYLEKQHFSLGLDISAFFFFYS